MTHAGKLGPRNLKQAILTQRPPALERFLVCAVWLGWVPVLCAADALGWPLIVNFHGCEVRTWLAFPGYHLFQMALELRLNCLRPLSLLPAGKPRMLHKKPTL
jgi:hypothetical protein